MGGMMRVRRGRSRSMRDHARECSCSCFLSNVVDLPFQCEKSRQVCNRFPHLQCKTASAVQAQYRCVVFGFESLASRLPHTPFPTAGTSH
eukprot:180513-Rhodomonas_salina.2